MDAGLAEADDRIGTPGDDPHRDRIAPSGRVHGDRPERGEGRVHRAVQPRRVVEPPAEEGRARRQSGDPLDGLELRVLVERGGRASRRK